MYTKLLILLSCAALTIAGDDKIYGGTQAAQGEIPWQVAVKYNRATQSCGGAIISNKYFLSSASCSRTCGADLDITKFEAEVGTADEIQPGTTHFISKIIVHEDYDSCGSLQHDIAIWEIKDTFTFNSNTAAIKLAAKGATLATGTATVTAGWGSLGGIKPWPDYLMKAVMPIYDHAKCVAAYAPSPTLVEVFDTQICAGSKSVNFCAGDDGGPLFYQETLYGIASRTFKCDEPGVAAIFTEVAKYRDWIKTNSGV